MLLVVYLFAVRLNVIEQLTHLWLAHRDHAVSAGEFLLVVRKKENAEAFTELGVKLGSQADVLHKEGNSDVVLRLVN